MLKIAGIHEQHVLFLRPNLTDYRRTPRDAAKIRPSFIAFREEHIPVQITGAKNRDWNLASEKRDLSKQENQAAGEHAHNKYRAYMS